MRIIFASTILVAWLSGAVNGQDSSDFPHAMSPKDSLAAINVRPGMKVELVAAEPLIVDPVAFDWGPDGRLWVVEMRDYPNGLDGAGKAGGRVKVLTDKDGDGRYDEAQLFLDDIGFPTGIKVWRKGILVTAAPDIFYAEDTDGDGKADKRETLYRGFGEGNQQHRVNGLRWGLDNWLHVGNGDSGGTIKSLKTGNSVNVNGRDLRIRPDDGLIEATSGQTQFGRNRDDWGNWFGGNNSNPMWHYVLDDRYLRRNPHFAPPSVRKQVSVQPGAARVFPTSRTLTRFNDVDRANRFTSACSPMIYRDELLGANFKGNAFICEPVHNLVHREIMKPDGVTFTSRRADDEQESEFLASRDNWFRPVMVRTGPDGALWIADMYRHVIEHPKWIPKDWQRRLDLRAGDDKGRIYRVYPADKKSREIPRLDKLNTQQLVAKLESPNGWVRDIVQQMLIWRNDKATVKPLDGIVASSKHELARLHALCALDGMNALKPETLVHAIGQPHSAVQRHALRIGESFFQTKVANARPLWDRYNGDPFTEFESSLPPDEFAKQLTVGDFVPVVLDTKNHSDMLHLQLAYSLGKWQKHGAAAHELAWVAIGHPSNPYIRAAVMSSLHKDNVSKVLEWVLYRRDKAPPDFVEQLLMMAMAIGDEKGKTLALSALLPSDDGIIQWWQVQGMVAVLDVLDRRMRLHVLTNEDVQQSVEKMFAYAREIVADADGDADGTSRATAIRLLGRGPTRREDDLKLLGAQLVPTNPHVVQSAALESLARHEDTKIAGTILTAWKSYSPLLRTQSLDILMSRERWTSELVKALETKQVLASHIDARRRQQLLAHKDDALSARADKVFHAASDVSRQKVIDQHKAALALPADAGRGKAVFQKRCSACHRLEGIGHAVGPDLAALTDRAPNSLLVAMLDPNRAVEDKFLDYSVATKDGRVFSGILVAETGANVTLKTNDGKEQAILREQIDQLRSTGKSMMPEGLEKDLSKQDVADVIAYLRTIGPPPKTFPGNKPEIVRANEAGVLNLLATNCKIYGSRIVFEEKYSNLGWWAREDDRAVWSLNVSKAGDYRVTIDYASHNDAAGDKFVLSVADQTIRGSVEGTGTWDDYAQKQIGIVTLPVGAADLVFRSDGKIKSALIDLRGIQLKLIHR